MLSSREADAPPLIRERRSLTPAVLLLLAAVGAVVVFVWNPAESGFYPLCYFNALTGLYCPGCGATRAAHQLLHGHIVAAARLNLLFVASVPFTAWHSARYVKAWSMGQRLHFNIRPVWIWGLLAVCTVFTVLRNLPGFEWLAP